MRYGIRAGGTYPTRNFATFRTVIRYGARLLDFDQGLSGPSINLPAPGRQIKVPIRRLSTWQSELCFLINSRSHLSLETFTRCAVPCAYVIRHPFRSYGCQFAEFLLPSSLKRLSNSARHQCRLSVRSPPELESFRGVFLEVRRITSLPSRSRLCLGDGVCGFAAASYTLPTGTIQHPAEPSNSVPNQHSRRLGI